jgi:hypothetical protein
MSHCQHNPRRATSLEHSRGLIATERKWLLAKDLFAGQCSSDDLLEVLRMRCCKKHGLDRRIGKDDLEVFDECEIMCGAEISSASSIWLDRMCDPEAAATSSTFNQASPPTSETCNCALDH